MIEIIESEPYWTTAEGEGIIYPELTDDHLLNIWACGYRNKWLLIEMLKRGFLELKRVNAGRCSACGAILISVYRHDFKSCDHSIVDGGTDLPYARYSRELKPLTKQEIINYLEEDL